MLAPQGMQQQQQQQQQQQRAAACRPCSSRAGRGALLARHRQQRHCRAPAPTDASAPAVDSAVACSRHKNNVVLLPRSAAAAAAAAGAVAAVLPPAAPRQVQQQRQQQQQVEAHQRESVVLVMMTLPGDTQGLSMAPPSTTGSSSGGTWAGTLMSRRLTRAIMAAGSLQELHALYVQQQADMNIIHVSATLSRLTRLARCHEQQQEQRQQQQEQQLPAGQVLGERAGLRGFLQQLEQHSMQLMGAEQLPQPAAVEVLRPLSDGRRSRLLILPPPPQQRQQHSAAPAGGAVAATVHSSGGQRAAAVMPQQLANMAWCYATLGHLPGDAWWSCYWAASAPLLPSHKPRELATTIWAASKLQQAPPAAWMAGFEAACVAGGALAAATPQELCMMLRGVAMLPLPPPSAQWVAALQAAVLVGLEGMAPRDLAQVLWGHARLGLLPPSCWTQRVLGAAMRHSRRFSARDAAMALWAVAALPQQQAPQQAAPAAWPWAAGCGAAREPAAAAAGGGWAGLEQQRVQQQQRQRQQALQLAGELLSQLQLSNCKLRAASPQDYAHIMWALAVLKQREQQQQEKEQQQQRLQPVRAEQSAQQDALGASALGEAQLHSWCSLTWQLTLPAGSSSSSSTSAANRSGTQPLTHPHHTSPWAAAAAGGAPAALLGPTDAAQLLWAATQLGPACWPPPAWLQQYWDASAAGAHLACASAQSLTLVLWASVRVGQPPPPRWLAAAVPALQRSLAELQPAAACQLLASLAALQHRPSPGFMQQLLCRLQLDAHQLQPRAFACVLWALGRLGYQPGAHWWATLLQHLAGGSMVARLGPRELANVLHGLIALGAAGAGQEEGLAEAGQRQQPLLAPGLRAALLRRAAELGESVAPAAGTAAAAAAPAAAAAAAAVDVNMPSAGAAAAVNGSSVAGTAPKSAADVRCRGRQLPLAQLVALL